MALVLVIEGLFPFFSPSGWRGMFSKILQMTDGQLRFFGLCSILGGVGWLWWLQP
jgi:uncharacterized protein